MRRVDPGRSHRTPIKHGILDKTLGKIAGVMSTGNSTVPAILPLHVIDMCAGDGVSEPGQTSSPEIILKHINFARLHGRARATFYEGQPNTFDRLRESVATIVETNGYRTNNFELIYGDSRDLRISRAIIGQAIYAHIDPNSMTTWPVTPWVSDTFTPTTTFLATLGCNVNGIKRLGFASHRQEWYQHMKHLLRVPEHHDVHLYILNRDDSQWAYLLRIPRKWSVETADDICKYGARHWPNGLRYASAYADSDRFQTYVDELFQTKKERRDGFA